MREANVLRGWEQLTDVKENRVWGKLWLCTPMPFIGINHPKRLETASSILGEPDRDT
jgi:hypothetical protein